MDMDEQNIKIKFTGKKLIEWFLELTTAPNAVLPFKKLDTHKIDCRFEGMNYSIIAKKGSFSKTGANATLTIKPENNNLILDLNTVN